MTRDSLMQTDEFVKFGYKIVKCPVCKKDTLDNYYVCPTCGWEYDPLCATKYSHSLLNGMSPLEYASKNLTFCS